MSPILQLKKLQGNSGLSNISELGFQKRKSVYDNYHIDFMGFKYIEKKKKFKKMVKFLRAVYCPKTYQPRLKKE